MKSLFDAFIISSHTEFFLWLTLVLVALSRTLGGVVHAAVFSLYRDIHDGSL